MLFSTYIEESEIVDLAFKRYLSMFYINVSILLKVNPMQIKERYMMHLQTMVGSIFVLAVSIMVALCSFQNCGELRYYVLI